MLKKMDAFYLKFTLMLTMCIMTMLPATVLAASTEANAALDLSTDLTDGSSGLSKVEWPWTRFLNSLAQEVTGPLPLIIGILAVCGAGFALLFGNGGAGTQKALTLICVIGVIMFTPTLVQYIYTSATGVTVDMVIGAVNAVSVAPPPLP